MAAEAANLAFETKAVDFSKRRKADNKFKTPEVLTKIEPCSMARRVAMERQYRMTQKARKCYLCDENHTG